ncbi:P-loop containing nucleoside triphosphate hydrolase protein [Suillus lakei]|nr:P-loop containing nucleoside triphosphate hydrolase protein [Suillus lakei]
MGLSTHHNVLLTRQPVSNPDPPGWLQDCAEIAAPCRSPKSLNNLPELRAPLGFVLPKIYNSVQSFDEWFNTPFANSGTGDKIELNEEEALSIIRRLHKVLRPFLLRRLKKDVESELPDKMKKHKMIANGKDAKDKYGDLFLFESVEDKVNPTGLIDDKLIRSAGKLELLSRILPKFFTRGHRALIFFQITKVMGIMEDFFKMMSWKYLRLDGGTKTEEHALHVQQFNAKDSEIQVFILSTRAGGLGLNLQIADTVCSFDRISTLIFKLKIVLTVSARPRLFVSSVSSKSVEEAMYARARYKLDIDDKVIQAGSFDNKSTQEEQEEFLRSILEADQEEENEEAGDMNDDELNETLARNDGEVEIFCKMDLQRERDALDAWRAVGNREIDDAIEGRGQRRRNVVNYNDGLSDEQWAMAVEDGEDLQELVDRARGKKERGPSSSAAYDPALTPMDEDERPQRGRAQSAGHKQVTSDDEYLTPSDEE